LKLESLALKPLEIEYFAASRFQIIFLTSIEGRAVVVSNLRRTVDANKNPLRLGQTMHHYAMRYQNELFQARPCLVIEVHGRVSGQYDVELTTGFDLDPDAPAATPSTMMVMRIATTPSLNASMCPLCILDLHTKPMKKCLLPQTCPSLPL
jgi:hypothetical protein